MKYHNPMLVQDDQHDENHESDAPEKDGHDDGHEKAHDDGHEKAHDEGHEEGHDNAHEGGDHSGEHAGDHAHEKDASEWTMQDSLDYYLSPDHLISHVQDANYFEWFGFHEDSHGHMVKNKIEIPRLSPWTEENPLVTEQNDFFGPITFQPSKFVVLELFAALILAAIFIPYANRVKNGDRPKGRLWNMLDGAVCYVRDEIAVPGIGSHDAPRFTPFVWSIFFFVLALNLIGMVPGLGAATGSISVTAALAVSVFFVVLATGMKKMGVVGFLKAQAPHMDISPVLKLVLLPMIWAIEVFGLFIKHAVLAVRLFANMFAGHLVVGVFVAFIGVAWGTWMVWGAVPVVILATIAVNLLELLVAFIQAYVFAFLTSLFIGAAIHPH